MRKYKCFKRKNNSHRKTKDIENFGDFTERIRKTLYYAKIPSTDRPSLPMTDILVNQFGEYCKKDCLDQLSHYEASYVCYNACVTPCSVILALVYLERLRNQNPEYLASTSSSQVFLVSLMVASKFLYDDGEEEEVYNDEWASSGAVLLADLNEAEINFLVALDWNIFVDVENFVEVLTNLETEVAKKQAMTRGFFIYSDLVTLSGTMSTVMDSIVPLLSSVFALCVASYTSVVVSLVGGTLLARHSCFPLASQTRPYTWSGNSTLQLFPPGHSAFLFKEEVSEAFAWTRNEESLLEEHIFKNEVQSNVLVGETRGKCTALRTLTTAFLLATSNFQEDPTNDLPSSPSFHDNGNLDLHVTPPEKNALYWCNSCFSNDILHNANVAERLCQGPPLHLTRRPFAQPVKRDWRKNRTFSTSVTVVESCQSDEAISRLNSPLPCRVDVPNTFVFSLPFFSLESSWNQSVCEKQSKFYRHLSKSFQNSTCISTSLAANANKRLYISSPNRPVSLVSNVFPSQPTIRSGNLICVN